MSVILTEQDMNIKKIVSHVGYALLCPVSHLCVLQTSRMTPAEAHRVLSQVYDIDRDDLGFIGGGVKAHHVFYQTASM